MYFSDAFKIEKPSEEDWFNLWLANDTKIYVDPMLVYQCEHKDFLETSKKIGEFFKEAFKRVVVAKNTRSPQMRDKALEMLRFKEPSELYLGYTNYGSRGSGIGKDFARQIYDAMVDFVELGFEDFGEYVSPLEIFVEGVGADRISDMIVNLMKEDLIKYTQKICNEKRISMKKFPIINASFDNNLGWVQKKVCLPENPLDKKPIILVPKDFLRTNSYLDREDFLEYILHMENPTLRQQATRLFTQDLDKKKLIEIIKQNPQLTKKLFKDYLENRKKEKAQSYDFNRDPAILNEIPRLISQIVTKIDKKTNIIETNSETLKSFVEKVIKTFKQHAESNDGYKILFNDDDSPRGEKIAQTLFHAIAKGFCCENGSIDITPESPTGKGPVDFKFSSGYNERILVELKLAGSLKLYHGLQVQTPEYLNASDLNLAYYLVIKQLAREGAKIAEVKDRYEKQKLDNGKKIILYLIDASKETKISASRI
jgi:hypothetical protein